IRVEAKMIETRDQLQRCAGDIRPRRIVDLNDGTFGHGLACLGGDLPVNSNCAAFDRIACPRARLKSTPRNQQLVEPHAPGRMRDGVHSLPWRMRARLASSLYP